MKENAIKRINTTGKVAYIISIVLRALVGVGAVLSLIGAIALCVLPEDAIKMKLGGDVSVTVDSTLLDDPITEQEAIEIEKEVDRLNEGGRLSLGNTRMEAIEASVEGNIINIQVHSADDGYTSLKDISNIIIIGFITCVAAFIALTFIGLFFKKLKNCQSPFENDVIIGLRNAAISIIPFAFLSSLTESVSNAIITGSYQVSFTLDFAVIIVVLLILALTFIFKYGAMLQQESDETL